VIFLVVDDARFLTGSTLSINGGHHMYCSRLGFEVWRAVPRLWADHFLLLAVNFIPAQRQANDVLFKAASPYPSKYPRPHLLTGTRLLI
jgi:hypothetical protein